MVSRGSQFQYDPHADPAHIELAKAVEGVDEEKIEQASKILSGAEHDFEIKLERAYSKGFHNPAATQKLMNTILRDILKAEGIALEAKTSALAKQAETLAKQAEKLRGQVTIYKGEISTLKEQNKTLQEQSKDLKEQNKALKEQLAASQSKIENLESQVKELSSKVAELEAAIIGPELLYMYLGVGLIIGVVIGVVATYLAKKPKPR